MARNRGAAVAAPASGDSVSTQRMRIPTNGPHDGDTLSPEITPAPGTVDFGAVRVPVPAGGTVSVEPSTAGRIQAVHVTVPEGRLSVSALAAPRTGGLWADLATEIDASLREGGARVRSFTGEWGRELHATTDGATSVFVGVDGPRWMLYGVATGPTRDAVGLDARLRRMLRGTVVVRGKAPFPVRTVLPLVTPSEGASEEQPTAAPPTMTLRATAAAAMVEAPKALTAGSDAAVPAPLAASVNGAVNGAVNGSTNGAVDGAVNGATANGVAAKGATTGVFGKNGVARTGSTTGATRNDVPTRGGSTTGASRAGSGVPTPPRGGSAARRRQNAANGTGASVPFPPTTNGAKRAGGTTGATPLGPAAAVNRPEGGTGVHPLGHSGATSLGPAAAVNRTEGGRGVHPLGHTGANRLGPAAAANRPDGGTGVHPLGHTGATPLGPAAAVNRPGGGTGVHPLGHGGATPLGPAAAANRAEGAPGAHPLGHTGANRVGPAAGVPGGANRPLGNTGGHPLGLNGASHGANGLGPAGVPGYGTGANPLGASSADHSGGASAPGAHPLGLNGASHDANRLGPAAADFAGGDTGTPPAGHSTGAYGVGADHGPLPTGATWSGAYPPPAAVAEPGSTPLHPGRPDGSAPPWSSTPSRPTGSFPIPAADAAPWPAGPPALPSLGSGRSQVPAAWAHESGRDRPASGFSVDDLVGGRPEPVSAPWEPSPVTPSYPPYPSYPEGPEATGTPPSDPRAISGRTVDRHLPGGDRDAVGRFDPLVDPLPMALDPLPAPGPVWTDGGANGRDDATDDRADTAGTTNGAVGPRWRAADLLRDRDRGDSRSNGSSGRWRAADLLTGRDDEHEAADTGSRKWLAADLLADRNGSDASDSTRRRSRTNGRTPSSRRDNDHDSAPTSRRGSSDDAAASTRRDSGRRGAATSRSAAGDDRAVPSWRGAGDDTAVPSWGGAGDDTAAASWRGSDDDSAVPSWRGLGDEAAAPSWRGAGQDPAVPSWRGSGDAATPTRRGDEVGAGEHGGGAARWRAADLLDGSEPHTNGRARRRRGAAAATELPTNEHAGASHDTDGVGPRWRAADLLDGRPDRAAEAPSDPAEPRRGRNGSHDRDNSDASTWQAAELLDGPATHAGSHEPSRWRAAGLLESADPDPVGGKWLAADLLDQRHVDDGDSGRRHAPAASPDAAPPSRVPPTQWAWPKEPEADPPPPRRAEGSSPSAWAAADLLDEGRHSGGRRRARETTRHGKPDDEDAGRHYRP